MGSAFLDAFTRSSSSASPVSSSGTVCGAKEDDWDHDKPEVCKVLEGKAVVGIVDVDTLPVSGSSSVARGEYAFIVACCAVTVAAQCVCRLFSRMRAVVIEKK